MFCVSISDSRHDLAERNAAIIRRNTFVPVSGESRPHQPIDRSLGQVSVLKAAAGQDNTRFPDPSAISTIIRRECYGICCEMFAGVEFSNVGEIARIMGSQSTNSRLARADCVSKESLPDVSVTRNPTPSRLVPQTNPDFEFLSGTRPHRKAVRRSMSRGPEHAFLSIWRRSAGSFRSNAWSPRIS